MGGGLCLIFVRPMIDTMLHNEYIKERKIFFIPFSVGNISIMFVMTIYCEGEVSAIGRLCFILSIPMLENMLHSEHLKERKIFFIAFSVGNISVMFVMTIHCEGEVSAIGGLCFILSIPMLENMLHNEHIKERKIFFIPFSVGNISVMFVMTIHCEGEVSAIGGLLFYTFYTHVRKYVAQ